MNHYRFTRVAALFAAMLANAAPAVAVQIELDYTYDGGFFNTAAKKAPLEAAKSFYSNILNDTLDAIVAPTYTSPRMTMKWTWSMVLNNPSGSGTITRVDQTVPANVIRVFVGAKPLPDQVLGLGGPGGRGWGRPIIPNTAISSDINQIYAIDSSFQSAVERRGETTGFAEWGGSIAFDSDRAWHFNPDTAPLAGTTDMYSVAIHELGHVLGFGATNAGAWQDLTSGSNFIGPAATSAHGGSVPLQSDRAHWQTGTSSTVFGGGSSQLAAMVEGLTPATRRYLTTLDAAALTDLGWSVIPPPFEPGDYNRNGTVDAADYVLWRKKRGQFVSNNSGPDGTGNGYVGLEDLTYWWQRYGNSLNSGAAASLEGSAPMVPEPSGAVLATILGCVALYTRFGRRG